MICDVHFHRSTSFHSANPWPVVKLGKETVTFVFAIVLCFSTFFSAKYEHTEYSPVCLTGITLLVKSHLDIQEAVKHGMRLYMA